MDRLITGRHRCRIIRIRSARVTGVIRNVKVERLKSQVMAEAQRAKEEIMDAASQEAIGMLVDDAKQQINDKAEEVQEAAKERQEEQ